ncbi:MAG: hypothetical protein EXR54_05320 [Dehalococcoidia bacterium]|nr:hypothetical protein [Dehalococcoidia bacterium]
MKPTLKKLLLSGLAVAIFSAGITLGLRAQGALRPEQESTSLQNLEQHQRTGTEFDLSGQQNAPVETVEYGPLGHHQGNAAIDYPVYRDLAEAKAHAGVIIKGQVVAAKDTPIDLGGRAPISYTVYSVKVVEAIKGKPNADMITVGQRTNLELATLGRGQQAFLLLKQVEHGTDRYT